MARKSCSHRPGSGGRYRCCDRRDLSERLRYTAREIAAGIGVLLVGLLLALFFLLPIAPVFDWIFPQK